MYLRNLPIGAAYKVLRVPPDSALSLTSKGNLTPCHLRGME